MLLYDQYKFDTQKTESFRNEEIISSNEKYTSMVNILKMSTVGKLPRS